ncbi:hypothetical protein [Bradyrhizobium glycinis]|uniref:hypothetical protein n=1 Tax=Bradyrhizobium glycinis TaxID=2751812 RepID=UPI0018D6C197|nr:hypothetical protein [Bradyrhizobium glycinis]MBH5369500.1 hypothetical protein [Bradyrhizobium glycinis]
MSVTSVSITVNQMVSSRTPAAIASSELVSNIHATLSALRGYLLTGNSQAKLDRRAMWKTMDAIVVSLMSCRSSLPAPKARTSGLKPRL